MIALELCLKSLVSGAKSNDRQARPGLDPFASVHRNETVVRREYEVDTSQFRRVDGRALYPLMRSGRSLVFAASVSER